MIGHFEPHSIKSDDIKLYHNAYDDEAKTSGYFVDVYHAIKEAQSHIIINGWAIEDIRIGPAKDLIKYPHEKQAPFHRPKLSDLLIEKSVSLDTVLTRQSPLILCQSWNHALEGGTSNAFYSDLKKAAQRYYLHHKFAISEAIKNINAYLANENDSNKINKLNAKKGMLKQLKQGTLPYNLIWRTNRGKKGTLTNSNHQKSISIDGQVAFTGGLDLAHGRDYCKAYKIKDNEPVFRDGAMRTHNPLAAQDIENSAFALALSKTRVKAKMGLNRKFKLGNLVILYKRSSHKDSHANEYLAKRINDIYSKQEQQQIQQIEHKRATWQVLRTVPQGQIKESSILNNPYLSKAAKQCFIHYNGKETDIKKAYIKAIDEAKSFVYIETQNFTTRTIKNTETIAYALGKKILSEHIKGHDFHVYLNLPRYPVLQTDDPDHFHVKFLSIAQKDTIKQLYRWLQENGIDDPSRYITISTQVKLEQDNHAQVYNHSKFMMTSECCVQGSANLSDRSMDGDRDSEHVVQIKFNDDLEVKQKYLHYLKELMRTHMGADFFDDYVEEHKAKLTQKGYIKTDDPSQRYQLRSAHFIASKDFVKAWQNELLLNQLDADSLNLGNTERLVALPHCYFKAYLTKDIAQNRLNAMRKLSDDSSSLLFSQTQSSDSTSTEHSSASPVLKQAPSTPQHIRNLTKGTTIHR